MKLFNLCVFGVLFFFNFVAADTLSVAKLDATGNEIGACLFWSPNKTQFDTLIKNVEKIALHEDKADKSRDGVSERKNFLSYLREWKTNTYHQLLGVLNGWSYEDRVFYRELPELVKFSDAGDLYMLQSLLIGEHWPLHAAHSNQGYYVPIWSEKETEEFYASRAQSQPLKPESPKQKTTKTTNVVVSDPENTWGL
jgi:hypothetical protein